MAAMGWNFQVVARVKFDDRLAIFKPQRLTAEEIREFAPAALRALAEATRFELIATAWDYGATADPARAQFCTVVARRRG